jgi:hypothetical protein
MIRARFSIFCGAALVAALGFGGSAVASDVLMAGGNVHFSTPDTWVGIMQTQGDPEVQVFQVPDSSPTGSKTLARVTVTVKEVANLIEFQQYVGLATSKAKALTGYTPGKTAATPNDFSYSAQESGAQLDYRERYWLANGHAIQLRCVRPANSGSGASWNAAFDKGCDAIAATLQS